MRRSRYVGQSLRNTMFEAEKTKEHFTSLILIALIELKIYYIYRFLDGMDQKQYCSRGGWGGGGGLKPSHWPADQNIQREKYHVFQTSETSKIAFNSVGTIISTL